MEHVLLQYNTGNPTCPSKLSYASYFFRESRGRKHRACNPSHFPSWDRLLPSGPRCVRRAHSSTIRLYRALLQIQESRARSTEIAGFSIFGAVYVKQNQRIRVFSPFWWENAPFRLTNHPNMLHFSGELRNFRAALRTFSGVLGRVHSLFDGRWGFATATRAGTGGQSLEREASGPKSESRFPKRISVPEDMIPFWAWTMVVPNNLCDFFWGVHSLRK